MKNESYVEPGVIFQENLQRFLSANGISQNSIALASGVSQKTVWSVVTGRSVPSLNTAQNVAQAAGVDASVLTLKALDPKQALRSKQVASLTSELLDLGLEDFAAVRHFVAALKKPQPSQRELVL
jgi:transcriptional regulator with XRE-family HTH domain